MKYRTVVVFFLSVMVSIFVLANLVVAWDAHTSFLSGSQFGQDRWVLSYLGYPRDGYYVDVGAADGVWGSNSYGMDKHLGWRGLCIDPFYKNSKTRTCKGLKEVVSDVDGKSVEFVVAGDHSGIQDSLDEWLPKVKHNKRVKFSAKSLKTIFADNNVPACINYLNLDIEGGEYHALSTFPFDQYCMQTITFEHNAFNKNILAIKKREKIRQLLLKHGYILIEKHRVDDFYAKKDGCSKVCPVLQKRAGMRYKNVRRTAWS